jgi:hypothetical protein
MKFMLLIHFGGDAPDLQKMSDDERNALYAAWGEINRTPGVTPGVQLQPPRTAKTVRVENGDTLTTDGPFTETKEALGGYCFLEAGSMEEAIRVASRVPVTWMGGAVEVRPVVESNS